MTVHRVSVLALDGMAPLDLAIPVQIFGPRTETPCQVSVCGPVSSASAAGGFTLTVTGGPDVLRAADTLIVPGFGPGFAPQPGLLPPAVLDVLATARDRGRRVVSICIGAFALAAAGLLDGLHATTHWRRTDGLERQYPAVHVDRDVLYVDEGNILTSAGVCCGIDLCLHIVRRDLGAMVANQIARSPPGLARSFRTLALTPRPGPDPAREAGDEPKGHHT
ncbi:AraC family transcriptional regulator [Streptomyces sp. NPDC002514]|uniref:AraC family transcriptional regulator n=1 Tax=unclassified Streptomyces TaxID=2593676 RepID=UPI00369F202D